MGNIRDLLNKIRYATYGKEVRQSIHDAIEECYATASVDHDNANMEVKIARGTHNTLNDRLVENEKKQENLSSQLEEKASKTDVQAANARIDTFTSLADGSTTGDAELIDGRVGLDGTIYTNIGGAIRNQIKKINDNIEISNIVTSYINLLNEGEMNDLTKFNGSNLSQETNGIRVSSDTSTTLISTKNGVNINEKNYCFIISFECDSNVNFNIEGYNGDYYFRTNINKSAGSYDLVFQLTRVKDGAASGVMFFINSLGACNMLIKKMMLISLDGTTVENLREIYNSVGFFLEYKAKNVYNKDEVNEKIEEALGNVNKTLYAYSDASVSGDSIDDNINIFIGSINNKNAIERALDTVRGVKGQKTTIICVGEFISNSFSDMLSNDYYGRGYKSFISFNNIFNVTLKGVGNKETKIEITLPDEGGVNYADYQIVNFDGINPTIENMKIIGKNMRYALHADTTGGTNYNEGSNFLIKDCEIKHIGQGANASASWTSPAGIGLGLSDKTTFTIENCIIQGVQSDIVGHDTARATEYKFTVKECNFSMATGTAFNWRLFSTSSRCNAIYEFIGNSFGDKQINIGNNVSGVNFYAIVKGYGNGIRFINNYNYLFSDEYEIKKAYNNDIIKNSIVDTYGNYSNGLLYGLALDDVAHGQEVRVLIKGLVNVDNIRVKEGETFVAGDYVTAENGAIKKSTIPTRWTIFEIWGKKYLRIE